MATRIQLRRGLEDDIRTILLASGEPAYALDTYKLFIGDGVTLGGIMVTVDSDWSLDLSGDLQPN